MPLQCRHTIDIVWQMSMAAWSFIVQNWGDPELQEPKKSPISRDKNMVLFGKCP